MPTSTVALHVLSIRCCSCNREGDDAIIVRSDRANSRRCNNCEIAQTAENNCVCHSMSPVSSSRPPSRIVKNGIAYLAKYRRVPLLSTSIYFPFNDNYLLCLKEHGQHLAPQGSPYKKSAEPIWAMAIAPPRTQTGTLGHFFRADLSTFSKSPF